MRVGPRDIAAIGVAACATGAGRKQKAIGADADANAAALAFVGAVLICCVFGSKQFDFILRSKSNTISRLKGRALGGDITVWPRTRGCDVQVIARSNRGSSRGITGLYCFTFALRAADADAEVNAARFVGGIGIPTFGDFAISVHFGGDLVVFAIDGGALTRLDCIRCIFTCKRYVRCRQCFHARVARIAGGLAHLLRRLNGANHRAGNRNRQTALFKLALDLVVAGFSGLIDINLLCADVDISLGRDDIATRLSVVSTCPKVDVTLRATYRRGCRSFCDALYCKDYFCRKTPILGISWNSTRGSAPTPCPTGTFRRG